MKQFLLKFSFLVFIVSVNYFTAKGQDAGVSILLSPTNGSCANAAVLVKVIVNNYGTSSITNIPVKATATGTTPISIQDTLKKTIATGKQDTLTFKSTINTTNGGTWNFKIYTILSGDINHANDTLKITITVFPIPVKPIGTGASRCGAGPLTFKAPSTSPGSATYWYASTSSTTPFSSGDTITRNISATTTYYAVSSGVGPVNTLTTILTGAVTHLGNMFNVKFFNTVTIDSFSVNFAVKGGDSLDFFVKSGTYVSFETTPSAWTKVGRGFSMPVGGGSGVASFVFNKTGLTLSGGKQYAFYIRATSKTGALDMTNNTDSFYNSDMVVYSGIGVAGNFGADVTPREWNGRIYYTKPGCSSAMVPVTGTIIPVVKNLVLSKNITSAGQFNKGGPINPDQICMGDSLKYDLSAPSNFLNSDYGTKWNLSYTLKTPFGTSSSNYATKSPSSTTNGLISFIPKKADIDSTYILTIKATNIATGCDTSLIRYLHVNSNIINTYTLANTCFGQPLNVTNNTTPITGLTYLWVFGDGDSSFAQTPYYKYKSSGVYNVSLTATNGVCPNTVTKSVTIYNAPYGAVYFKSTPFMGQFNTGDVIDPDNICVNDTNTYLFTSPKGLSNADYGSKWTVTNISFKTGFGYACPDTIFHKPTTSKSGYFQFFPSKKFSDSVLVLSITLRTLPGNCDSVMVRYLAVRPKANSKFGITNACMGVPVSFIDSSFTSNPNDKVTHWSWTFGDGQVSSAQNPKHPYAKPGIYSVTLNATTDFGCGIPASRTVQQFPLPLVRFSDILACNGLASSFKDSSSVSPGTVKLWNWYFGDGFKSNMQNPTNIYVKSGPYNVKLVSITNFGCKDSFAKKIIIQPTPVPRFTDLSACVGNPVYFANTSTDSFSNSTYSWDFADGGNSASAAPQHTYTTNGTYKIILKVISQDGCSDTVSHLFTPDPKPKVNFSSAHGCPGQNTTFFDSSKEATGSLYNWTFGDGGKDAQKQNTETHIYSKPGTYSVKLMITTPGGCIDSQRRNVIIDILPKAGFTTANVCVGKPASFTNTSTGIGTLTYKWYPGDNSIIQTSKDLSHTYANAGIYPVKLAAINSTGCADTFHNSITINPLPDASWSRTHTDYIFSFLPKDTTLSSYLWYFGTVTNDSSSKKKPVFTYPSVPAKYTVKLIVTNSNGCINSKTDSIRMPFDVGINYQGLHSGYFSVYPNPFENVVHISYNLDIESKVSINLFDLQGKLMARVKNGIYPEGLYKDEIESRKYDLPEGIYILKISINDIGYFSRIVKIN